MINIIVSILFLLFVTSLTLTLFTIIKHTEKVLPVLEQFKWPLVNTPIPTTSSLTKYTEYSVEERIKNKLISINDDENDGYKLYFDNQSIKNKFIFDVTNYDFVFYYAQIDQDKNKYYIPKDYVFSNSRDNKKPTGTGTEYKFRIGLVLTQVQETGLDSNKIINIDYKTLNLYNHITTNMLLWINTNNKKVYKFVKSFNNYTNNYTFNNSLIAEIIEVEPSLSNQSGLSLFDCIYIKKVGYLYVDDKQNINIIYTELEPTSTVTNFNIYTFDINENKVISSSENFVPQYDFNNRFDYNFNILKYNNLYSNINNFIDGNYNNLAKIWDQLYPKDYYQSLLSPNTYNMKLTRGSEIIELKTNMGPSNYNIGHYHTLFESRNNKTDVDTKLTNIKDRTLTKLNIQVLPLGINNPSYTEIYLYYVPDFINLDYSYTLEITKN